jgi:hypothetical protein
MSRTDLPSPSSPADTPKSSRRSSTKANLKLDLSNLPPVVQPAPPSNTIIITVRCFWNSFIADKKLISVQKLDNPAIFNLENLQSLRETINQHGAIHTWSPFKSFSRIIIVFYDISVAKLIKETLDGELIMDCQVKTYFANHTNLSPTSQHLAAPKSDKLFFISPPPSPPHDWEVRNEGPPNKSVHPEDLADALSKLHARNVTAPDAMEVDEPSTTRGRSSSVTVVYHPKHYGSNLSLPAISVEDTDVSKLLVESPIEDVTKEQILHTARPPIELMEH